MNWRRIFAIVLLLALAYAVISNPTGSANTVGAIWDWILDALGYIGTFFSQSVRQLLN